MALTTLVSAEEQMTVLQETTTLVVAAIEITLIPIVASQTMVAVVVVVAESSLEEDMHTMYEINTSSRYGSNKQAGQHDRNEKIQDDRDLIVEPLFSEL